MTAFSTPLKTLRFGHDAKPPINARRSNRLGGVDALADSIAAHGLIQALTVRHIDGEPYVVDGNRRLAALQLLVERKRLHEDTEIRCEGREGRAGADEISLAANVMRMPLHEADQYEAFRELAERGLEENDIAVRFGIETHRVAKMLALGRLSPAILEAWRKGELGPQAAEIVRAFTLAPSPEAQERVFRDVVKSGNLFAHLIRKQFGAGDHEARRFLAFVGVDNYTKAGGALSQDLFGDDHGISDTKLVAKLAEDKLQAMKKDRLAEGWSWAALSSELPYEWTYSWHRLPVKKKATAEEKAKSGAVIALGHDGTVTVTYGVVKPEPKKRIGEAGTAEEKPAAISQALHHRLSISATVALREALATEPRLGLIALLAGFSCRPGWYVNGGDVPIRVSHQGFGHQAAVGDPFTFEEAFEKLLEFDNRQLFDAAAAIAARAVSLECGTPGGKPFEKGGAALAAAIDAEAMTGALAANFDIEDYFGSVPKAIALKAIEEVAGPAEAKAASAMKKVDLKAFAIRTVTGTSWLPAELRTAHYVAPGAGLKPKRMKEAAE